jgi:inhibitor of KinA
MIIPLGDQAALAYLSDETAALRFAAAVRESKEPWLVDVVQAYTSVAVYFDLDRIRFVKVADRLRALADASQTQSASAGQLHQIPCCYDLGPDLKNVAKHTGLSTAEAVCRHAAQTYTVYAIGFCPGFPYLGYLPPELCGVPRLDTPRLKVEAGSVGLTGRQTGIYTEERPGGWNLIGRTPLELVNVADGYFPLRTGDRVQFVPIPKAEFKKRRGERLPVAETAAQVNNLRPPDRFL